MLGPSLFMKKNDNIPLDCKHIHVVDVQKERPFCSAVLVCHIWLLTGPKTLLTHLVHLCSEMFCPISWA